MSRIRRSRVRSDEREQSFMKPGHSLARVVLENRALIWQLALHQIRQQYAATLLGSLWAVVQPISTIFVFWFVFSHGFKMKLGPGEHPYFLVLFCGFIPWMAFAEAVQGGANAIGSHAYLVRKIAFPLEILPLVPVVAATVVHIAVLGFVLVVLMIYGVWPTVHLAQIPYYLLAGSMFAAAWALLLSGLNVFHRDVGQAVGLMMTLWFWLTPIVWPIDQIAGPARAVIELNPMHYVVQGYRASLLYHEPLTASAGKGLLFWCVTALLFAAGWTIFRRLKPHFADVV